MTDVRSDRRAAAKAAAAMPDDRANAKSAAANMPGDQRDQARIAELKETQERASKHIKEAL